MNNGQLAARDYTCALAGMQGALRNSGLAWGRGCAPVPTLSGATTGDLPDR